MDRMTDERLAEIEKEIDHDIRLGGTKSFISHSDERNELMQALKTERDYIDNVIMPAASGEVQWRDKRIKELKQRLEAVEKWLKLNDFPIPSDEQIAALQEKGNE